MKTVEAMEEINTLISALRGMELGLWLDEPRVFRGKLEYAIREMRPLADRLESELDDLEPVPCEYVVGEFSGHGLRIPFREAP